MDIGGAVAQGGHEQLVFAADDRLGLRLVIAVHSTALGPALGGIRFWRYADERSAVVDALALSEAMTLKASMAGLDQGGGKAVCMVDDPAARRSPEFLHAIGRSIHELGGRYLAAEDVGASQYDMDTIDEVTPWVTGVDPARGGSGDPSPFTARGVLAGMRAACAYAFGEPSVAGRRVIVQGAGHVGSHLVALLVDADADVAVADVDDSRAAALGEIHGVETVPADAALDAQCDILSPCALGGVVDSAAVARLAARVVCGAANNQLVDEAAARALEAAGVVYAPDFVVNAGGIINIAQEFTGYSAERASAATDEIEPRTVAVLEHAHRVGLTPSAAATELARERVRTEGRERRFMPGDPAPWTGGEPLRRLRPGV